MNKPGTSALIHALVVLTLRIAELEAAIVAASKTGGALSTALFGTPEQRIAALDMKRQDAAELREVAAWLRRQL